MGGWGFTMKILSLRRAHGATLALVVAAAFIIIMLGVGLFFLARIAGGERELQHATDSGTLNVAKQVIVRPNVQLTDNEKTNFRLLTDKVDGADVVNLKVYNRLVGQAMLVALNAQADPSQQGKDNAADLFDQIQSDGGIGDRLSQSLGVASSSTGFFESLGMANSLRMLSPNKTPVRIGSNDSHYATAWMEQREPADIGATNLTAPGPDQVPTVPSQVQFPTSYITRDVPSGKLYVRGYRPLTFDLGNKGIRPLVGVPVQPGKQPHLVSNSDFESQIKRPNITGPQGKINFPPNAFQTSGKSQETVTASISVANARSLVGVLGQQYPPQIPGGYLIVQNGKGVDYKGTQANFNTVLNGQLDGGILVNPQGFFTSNPGLLGTWAVHNKKNHAIRPNTDGPTVDNLYDRNGNPVDKPKAHTIKDGANLVCNDHNTHPDGGGNRRCHNLLDSFERAYTPGWNGDYQQKVPGTSTNLTAIEGLKADLEYLFNKCGVLKPSNSLESGMRWYKYPCTGGSGPLDCPWPQNATTPGGLKSNFPQISSNGSLKQLISLASGDWTGEGDTPKAKQAVKTLRAFVKQRLAQIGGKVGDKGLDQDVNVVMNMANIPLGATMYIYYTYPQGSAPQIQVTPIPPSSITAQAPDGTPVPFTHLYPRMIGSKINSTHDHLVDKNPFQKWTGKISARETVTLQPSTGFNNLLGVISMKEEAALTPVSGPSFCEPD